MRNFGLAMSTTLPLFWNLSSAKKKERLDASVKLITVLETLQASHVPVPVTKGSSEEEDEDADEEDEEDEEEKNPEDEALNLLNAADVSYSVRRLIRGLASPRESSRLGFSVALTEVCSRWPFHSTKHICLTQVFVCLPMCCSCSPASTPSPPPKFSLLLSPPLKPPILSPVKKNVTSSSPVSSASPHSSNPVSSPVKPRSLPPALTPPPSQASNPSPPSSPNSWPSETKRAGCGRARGGL